MPDWWSPEGDAKVSEMDACWLLKAHNLIFLCRPELFSLRTIDCSHVVRKDSEYRAISEQRVRRVTWIVSCGALLSCSPRLQRDTYVTVRVNSHTALFSHKHIFARQRQRCFYLLTRSTHTYTQPALPLGAPRTFESYHREKLVFFHTPTTLSDAQSGFVTTCKTDQKWRLFRSLFLQTGLTEAMKTQMRLACGCSQ